MSRERVRHSGVGWVPDPVKEHPLGMLAMWAWTLLGFSLAVPAFGGDPKPWPDILWPALLSPDDFAESSAMGILAVAMILSGLSFLISQCCMNGVRRWPGFVRHNSLWLSLLIVAYVISGMLIKVMSEPDEDVVWWWPLSLMSWIVTGFFISLATRRSLLSASGARFYPETDGGGRK